MAVFILALAAIVSLVAGIYPFYRQLAWRNRMAAQALRNAEIANEYRADLPAKLTTLNMLLAKELIPNLESTSRNLSEQNKILGVIEITLGRRLDIEMRREADRQQDREARITAANGRKLPTLFKIGDEIYEMKDDGSIIRRVEGDRPHVRVVTDPSPDAPRFESVP